MYEEYTQSYLDRHLNKNPMLVDLICPICDGDGELYTSHRFDCSACEGKGRIAYDVFLERINLSKLYKDKKQKRRDIDNLLNPLSLEDLEKIYETIKECIHTDSVSV